MRAIALAVIALAALPAAPAHAERFDAKDLLHRVEVFVGTLLGRAAPDSEVVRPPGDIDPQMALKPPPGGMMRVIRPPVGDR